MENLPARLGDSECGFQPPENPLFTNLSRMARKLAEVPPVLQQGLAPLFGLPNQPRKPAEEATSYPPVGLNRYEIEVEGT